MRESDQRGRHTTVARELVLLPSGAILVDTPGLRSVGLWDADQGFEEAFADIETLAPGCRFDDCRHRSEPGCAVLAAVARGELDGQRVQAYLRLDGELDQLAEREVERATRSPPPRQPAPRPRDGAPTAVRVSSPWNRVEPSVEQACDRVAERREVSRGGERSAMRASESSWRRSRAERMAVASGEEGRAARGHRRDGEVVGTGDAARDEG